jgi:sRNA-binding protein
MFRLLLSYNRHTSTNSRPTTAMTETQTESHTAASKRIIAQLQERWPALFELDRPVLLAVGIHESLAGLVDDADTDQIKRALAVWCSRSCYLKAMVAGAGRHGLEGVHGEVTEEHAAEAAATLKQRKAADRAKLKAKKAAIAETKRKEAEARAQRLAQAEAKKLAEEQAAAAKQPAQAKRVAPPARPISQGKPRHGSAATAPVTIIMKKRRFGPSASDTTS